MDNNLVKVIVCLVVCICVTVLCAMEIVAGSTAVGVLSSAMGYIFGRMATQSDQIK